MTNLNTNILPNLKKIKVNTIKKAFTHPKKDFFIEK